jgi:peptide/nickel transport system permease protein
MVTPLTLERLKRSTPAWIGGGIVLAAALLALLAPFISPIDPNATNFLAIRSPPSPAHWLGTDELGRDVLSRLLHGTQATLLTATLSLAIAGGVGVPLGLLAGWKSGALDMAISRLTDALLACPFLILAVAFAAVLGPSLTNAIIAIGLSAAPIFIRLARGQAISIKTEDYIESARAIGANDGSILISHVTPNAMPPLIVQATLSMAQAILSEASLSFLGLGQQPPAASWGAMLHTGLDYMGEAPWLALAPGAAIFLLVAGLVLFADALREALDPQAP